MKSQSLRWLVVAAVIALGAALYASVRKPVLDAAIGVELYPDLEAKLLNDVTAVRIHGAGDQQVVGIEKSAAGWQVTERANYPADVGRVRELLLALAKATTLEKKTAIATNLPALGLEDLTASGATGERPGGSRHAAPGVAHHRRVARRAFLVRAPCRRGAKLADRRRLHVEGQPRRWVQSKVLEVPQARVSAIGRDAHHGWTGLVGRQAFDGRGHIRRRRLTERSRAREPGDERTGGVPDGARGR